MTVRLRPIRREDLPSFCAWREAARPYLRTPFVINLDQQIKWYEDVVCDRRATDRFWAIEVRSESEHTEPIPGVWPKDWVVERIVSNVLVGIGGLTDIEWENGLAEITLVLAPTTKGKGYGEQAFDLVLAEAFDAMRLLTVIAETYTHNPSLGFWRRMAEKRGATVVVLPRRKFWNGRLYDAEYFSFVRPA